MPTTIPAMKARLGNTDYYILSMKAGEFVKNVWIPKELEGWEDLSVEERYQRDINYNRVKKQIAPYLVNEKSRFFGAFIVAAMHFGEAVSFEPLSDVTTKGLPGLYRSAASDMGFLTFAGGEMLVPLDGQHRLKAIQFAITGKDDNDRDIPDITPCPQLAQEDVTVVLVAYEPQKARKIFTRVNRYAKPTTAGQNIVTDDDDFAAVLAREITNDEIGGRLAKYASNTLRANDPEFTTLAIIYNCNKAIIETFPYGRLDTTRLPDDNKQRLYRQKTQEVWKALLEGIDVFADALGDKEETGDENRREIRKANLLGKPVAQECLVKAFLRLTGAPTNMGYQEARERLNALPWGITEDNIANVWGGALWTGGASDGRIITKNRNLATGIIAYLAGERLTEEKETKLLEDYRRQFPESERKDMKLPELAG